MEIMGNEFIINLFHHHHLVLIARPIELEKRKG
jgi:hypothetical protein